jgi:hypothetical protein
MKMLTVDGRRLKIVRDSSSNEDKSLTSTFLVPKIFHRQSWIGAVLRVSKVIAVGGPKDLIFFIVDEKSQKGLKADPSTVMPHQSLALHNALYKIRRHLFEKEPSNTSNNPMIAVGL